MLFLAPALLLCSFLRPTRAHTIELGPALRDCYFEDLHTDDKVSRLSRSCASSSYSRAVFVQMTVTYQVGGGGHLDIDFWVRSLATASTLVFRS